MESGWCGILSCGYATRHLGMIWGQVAPTSVRNIQNGELIITIPNFPPQKYHHRLNGFGTDATIIEGFVLTNNGNLKIYNDNNKITFVEGRFYSLWGLFWIN